MTLDLTAVNKSCSRALRLWARRHRHMTNKDGIPIDNSCRVTLTAITESNMTVEVTDKDGNTELESVDSLSNGDAQSTLTTQLEEAVAWTGQHAWEDITRLFAMHGSGDYIGEAVTQEEHMTQAGEQARLAGSSPDVILGALLHDVGHLIGMTEPGKYDEMGGCGTLHHERIGANFALDHGLSQDTADVIQGHVDAKRYLCHARPEYYDKLTDASKTTLTFQGGVMTREEAKAFEQLPTFHDIIRSREWDEAAKVVDAPDIPPLSSYKPMVIDAVKRYNPICL